MSTINSTSFEVAVDIELVVVVVELVVVVVELVVVVVELLLSRLWLRLQLGLSWLADKTQHLLSP
jgi:hypothetical protein